MVIVREPHRPLDRAASLAAAAALAAEQAGIVSRRQLAREGSPRWVVRLELRTGRWAARGRQCVSTHNGPLGAEALRWVAVLEVGARAALDGVSALQAAGVTGLTDEAVVVITPKGSTPAHPDGVVVRESRLFREDDVIDAGIRRVRPAVAAVHAALWASTDRQAAYFLTLVVQQRHARPSDLAAALARVRRHRRRLTLRAVIAALVAGSESLGELDVSADLHGRGIPVLQQVVRRRPSGTEYLDIEIEGCDVCVEVDGIGHDAPAQRLSDLVRDIRTLADGKVTVRVPLVAYVVDKEQVLEALEALLRSRGWRSAA